MSGQWKWVIGIVSIVVVVALLACGIFFGWRYFFAGRPSVVITSPPSNYQAVEGDEVAVEATASGRSITMLELQVDGVVVNRATSPSPQDTFSAALTWQASGVGPHTVEARASDAKGQVSEPAAVVVIVTTEVAEITPTVTVGPPLETPTTPSPSGATPTPTSPAPTATPTLAPPVIEFFTADPEIINEGESSTLSWGFVTDATSVEIDQGIGGVGTPDSIVVSPASTTTHTMTAIGPGGTTTESVTVTVIPAGPPMTVVIQADESLSGNLSSAGCSGLPARAGIAPAGNGIRGVASFEILDLNSASTIMNATLDLSDYTLTGDPFEFLHPLHVEQVEYQNRCAYPDTYSGSALASLAQLAAAVPGLTNPIDVTAALADYLASGNPDYFQIRLRFDGDDAGSAFASMAEWSTIQLTVVYQP